MANTGRNVKMERRIEILDRYMCKLRRSGYGESTRKEILTSGMNGYYNRVITELKGGIKVNRRSSENRVMRKIMKVVKNDTWHDNEENDKVENININCQKRKSGDIIMIGQRGKSKKSKLESRDVDKKKTAKQSKTSKEKQTTNKKAEKTNKNKKDQTGEEKTNKIKKDQTGEENTNKKKKVIE